MTDRTILELEPQTVVNILSEYYLKRGYMPVGVDFEVGLVSHQPGCEGTHRLTKVKIFCDGEKTL